MFQLIKQGTGTVQRRFKCPDRCYCRRIKGHVCSSVYSVIAPYPRCSILYTMLRSDAIDNVNKERCVLWGSVETQVSTFLHPTSAVHRTTRMYSYNTINIFKLAKYFCEFENIWAIEISLNQCRRIEFSFYDKIFSAEDQIFLYTPPLQPGTGQQPCRAGQHSTAGPGLGWPWLGTGVTLLKYFYVS